MSKKPIVAIDMDDTILYLMKAIQKDHNKKHPDHQVTYEQMEAFRDEVFHPDYNKMDFFLTPGTFRNLEPIDEHVIDEIKKLSEKYDVVIVTSAFPQTVGDKWAWLQEHMPFIPFKNFITASRKDLINADILIDDAIHNVKAWTATGRPAIGILHHWNTELISIDNVTMVHGWKSMSALVDMVLERS